MPAPMRRLSVVHNSRSGVAALSKMTRGNPVPGPPISGFGSGKPFPFKKQLRPAVVRWRHRGVTERDIFLCAYPRSGSTWLRFLLFDVLTGEEALFGTVNRSIPYVGQHSETPSLLPGGGRLIQSHELYIRGFMKAVYIVRDARSVVLSEFRFMRHLFWYQHNLDRFLDEFIRGEVNPFGTWDAHVKFWLDSPIARERDLLLIKFEDLREDTIEALKRIVSFLGVEPNGEAIEVAIRNNDIVRMRAKEERALEKGRRNVDRRYSFVGKGSATGWSSALNEEQIFRLEQSMGTSLKRLGYQLKA